jgi:hypothetical protein
VIQSTGTFLRKRSKEVDAAKKTISERDWVYMLIVPRNLDSQEQEIVRILRLENRNAQLDKLTDFQLYQLWQIDGVDLKNLRVPKAGELCPDCQTPYSTRGGCACRR